MNIFSVLFEGFGVPITNKENWKANINHIWVTNTVTVIITKQSKRQVTVFLWILISWGIQRLFVEHKITHFTIEYGKVL